MKHVLKACALSIATLVVLFLCTSAASAACTTPAGNAGDVVFSSLSGQMAYCNGTSWVGMGASQPVGFGTLTSGDFCLATSGTQISCTTATIPASSITAIAGLSVLGTATTATAAPGPITGTANQVLTVNSAGTGLVFGSLNLSSAAAITGTLGAINGGTGLAAYTTGDILYASATNTLSRLPIGTTGWVLTASPSGPVWAASTGGVTSFSAGTTGLTPNSPSTGAIVLAGTLGVPNGGTGLTALTSNVIYKGNGTGNLVASGLTDNGTIVSSSESIDATGKSYITEIANGSVATVLNTLAKLDTSGNATKALATDTDGIVGIVVGGAGTTGTTAQIAIDGQATCVFDGTAVVGHFVTISSTTAGDCHDTGAATRSTTGQTIGRVLTGGTTATVALGLNGAGGGAASGSTGYVQFNNSGAFLGTSNLFWDNTNNRLGIGTSSPNASAILDLTSTTQGLLPPRVTTSQMTSISSPAAGLTVYNSTIGAIDVYNGSTWMAGGGGGGQLVGVYSCSTAVNNATVTFSGSSMTASPTNGICGNVTVPSYASYIIVELWGPGGGGAAGYGGTYASGGSGGGSGGYVSKLFGSGTTPALSTSTTYYYTTGGGGAAGASAGSGGSNGASNSCFGTNSTACSSPILQASFGGGSVYSGSTSYGNATSPGGGGVGSGGDLNLAGSGGTANGGFAEGSVSYTNGGTGGGAPRGGGGGVGNSGAGGAPGGGGGGGGNSGAGGAGAAGGLTVWVYTSGVTNGAIGAGTSNGLAYYSANGTSLSSLASTANAILATNSSGVPAFTTAETVLGSNVGIGSISPGAALTVTGAEALNFGTDYSTIGTSQNNVNLGATSSVRYTGSGVSTFTGIVAGTSNVGGEILTLHNASTSALTLSNQNTNSTILNRIITGTGADLVMSANSSVIMQYDGSTNMWRVIGGSGGGGIPAGTTGQVQFNSGTNAFAASTNLTWDNTNFRLGIGSATPTVALDLSQKTDALALPVGTSGTRPTCSAGSNGILRYNSTIPAVEACVNGAWVSVGAGGGQMLGSFSTGTAVTNYSVVFTGAANSAPSLSGSVLTLASNTAYMTVELWGGGGGGSGGGSGPGGGGSGSASYFSTTSPASTTPLFSATGGGGGSSTVGGVAGSGASGSITPDIMLTGQGATGHTDPEGATNYIAGSAGGSAPRGGGGGHSSYSTAGGGGSSYGGGGAGGGISGATTGQAAGPGGGGGGYASKFIPSPAGVYYFTVGGGGAGGTAGVGPATAGGAGGAGGITITAYSSGSTQAFNMGTQATGTLGVANGGTGTTTPFTQGSALFAGASGVYSQDNVNFFYDATNHRLGIGTNAPASALQVNGVETLAFGTDYSTAGTQNNVNLGATSSVRYTGTGVATFTGIVAGTSNVAGAILHLHNASTSALTVSNQNASSTASNEVVTGTGADLVMASNSSIMMQYDGASSVWRVIGGSGGSSGGSATVWSLINTIDITTAQTTASFTGLSGDTDVEYQIFAHFVAGSGTAGTYYMLPNADASSSDYGFAYVQTLGSTVTGGTLTSVAGLYLGDTGGIGHISNSMNYLYAKSGTARAMTSVLDMDVTGTTNTYPTVVGSVWNNTASPITSLQVTSPGANGLGVGTHIELWAKRTVGGSGGSATPGGTTGQVQFNNAGAFGGATALTYAATGTNLLATAQTVTDNPLAVRGMASQSGDLTQWQNTGGTPLARISAAGDITTVGKVTLTLGADLTTAGSQNNVNVGAQSSVRYSGTGAATFTGIIAGTVNIGGTLLTLHNASTSVLTISNQSSSSSAANRVITGTGADLAMAAGSSIMMQYDGTANLWRVIGGTGSGGGGGQLLGVYSSGTAVTNSQVVFTGAAGNAPSYSAGVLTLPSNTAYIVVETWGGGGGGGGGGDGGTGTNGNITCFGSTSTCTTGNSILYGGGGSGSAGNSGNGAAGGTGVGGDINLTGGYGGGDATSNETNYSAGGVGGSAPLGGGGGGNTSYNSVGVAGSSYGGGGGGGGMAGAASSFFAGGGGGGGGYASKLITNPTGPYYYTIGAAVSGGAAATTCGGCSASNGGAGGSGGIKISAYSSGSTQAFNVGPQATGTLGVANGGTGATTPFTQGSAIFAGASGVYSQDNANFFYDATNHRLGIGTTAPQAPFEVSSTGTGYVGIFAGSNGGAAATVIGARLGAGAIQAWTSDAQTTAANLGLQESGGNVGIGTPSPSALEHIYTGSVTSGMRIEETSADPWALQILNDGYSTNWANATGFWQNTNGNFYIQNAGGGEYLVPGGTAWTSTSDIRLKKNVKTLSVLDRLDGFRAVSFDWKASDKHDLGVIAQELYRVFPELVIKGDDDPNRMVTPGDRNVWGVSYDRLGAIALEGLKELKVLFDADQTDIATLKADNDNLRIANDHEAAQIKALTARLDALENTRR